MSFTDKTLQCCDCNATFTFSASEQELFANKGYTNDPKACPTCRAARRTQRGDNGGSMGYRGSNSMGYQGTQRQMFPATCATCGQATQVPFEPRTARPVYCSNCYSKVRR
ncbi:MAG: zinc-ribbon domain containing protein [Chloroflexi bacterium]|nr:zinc-ribbon domain containing protein [Chloroflexota bacterium]